MSVTSAGYASRAGAAIAILLLASGARAQVSVSDVVGVWIDHTKQGAVEITRCGASVCGRIYWMEKPNGPDGKPARDVQNSDAQMRNLPMCGLQIIGDATTAGAQGWVSGWIYNPDDGVKYSVDIRRRSAERLEVHGYLGFRALGETFVWTRAPETVVRCTP